MSKILRIGYMILNNMFCPIYYSFLTVHPIYSTKAFYCNFNFCMAYIPKKLSAQFVILIKTYLTLKKI